MKPIEVKKEDYTKKIVTAMNGVLRLTDQELKVLAFLLDEDIYNVTPETYRTSRIRSGLKIQNFSNVVRSLERKKVIVKTKYGRGISPALSTIISKGEINIKFERV